MSIFLLSDGLSTYTHAHFTHTHGHFHISHTHTHTFTLDISHPPDTQVFLCLILHNSPVILCLQLDKRGENVLVVISVFITE